MAIQHKDIPNSELHESKGVSSAVAGTVYVANGAGSGTWDKLGSASLKNSAGDGGIVGLAPLTDGVGGFAMKTNAAYGVMGVTNNNVNFPMSAAVDSTLVSTSDYVLFTGTGAPWAGESLYGVTFNTNRLIAPVAGVYEVKLWANISTFPTNTARVGVRFRVNGTTFSVRTLIVKSNSSGDYGSLNAFGLITLAANDYVQMYVASSATGNLGIQNANLTLDLKRAT